MLTHIHQQLAASNVSLFSVNLYKNGKVHTGAFYLIILEKVPSQPFLSRSLVCNMKVTLTGDSYPKFTYLRNHDL